MKCALVLDWPSLDAQANAHLSEWEAKVTQELLEAAGYKPDLIAVAHKKYVRHWPFAFVGNKVGGTPLPEVEADRQALLARLAGYDMCLAMGSHALWALTGETKIDTYRGTHIDCPFVEGLQVVPTYAPSLYARMAWAERPVVVSAMRKATKRYEDQDRTVYLAESIADLYWFSTKFIQDEIVFDVETNGACRITEFSVASSPSECLYVQLETRDHKSIWSEQDELDIWLWLHMLSVRKDLAWVAHNATYDLTYLDAYGIRPRGPIRDTMLRHHAFQPELEKSLGFLASLYVPTRAWKHLRMKAKRDFNKAGAL
jgi:hypothetical protein